MHLFYLTLCASLTPCAWPMQDFQFKVLNAYPKWTVWAFSFVKK